MHGFRGRAQWLVQRAGSFWERGRVLEFPPSINEGTLGRSFSCTWRFNDPTVSRLHAAFVRRPRRGVYLVDLGSRRGTFVNGRRIGGELLLMDGDVIRLGDRVSMEFMDNPPPVEAPERVWFRRAWWLTVGAAVLALASLFVF
jgi:predicted component of type VI protein secretion system